MSQKNRYRIEISYDALLPLVELLLCESTREARLAYANELSEAASTYEVTGFNFADGHRFGFGDDDAKSPNWPALDKSGDLTKALAALQSGAVFKFWAQFLRDPAGFLWKMGGDDEPKRAEPVEPLKLPLQRPSWRDDKRLVEKIDHKWLSADFRSDNLTKPERQVLYQLYHLTGGEGEDDWCNPSIADLARLTGLNNKSAVYKALNGLEAKNYVVRDRSPCSPRGASIYRERRGVLNSAYRDVLKLAAERHN